MLTILGSLFITPSLSLYLSGWINDENPLEKASKIAEANHFQTPIDEIDAAARILDPIISAKNNKSDVKYGCFFKDYKETEW